MGGEAARGGVSVETKVFLDVWALLLMGLVIIAPPGYSSEIVYGVALLAGTCQPAPEVLSL